MHAQIAVVGALGNVGAEVVTALRRLGVPVRAADLKLETIRARFPEGVEAVHFDFMAPDTIAPTLHDVRRLFLMRPPQITDVQRWLFPVIDVAKAVGVEQVVFLSLINIEKNQRAPHYKVEQYLRTVGLGWTFLRASFFMQNLSTTHRAEIRDHSRISVPVGHGKTSFIDVRDIGAVAALVLTQPGHLQRAYDLTGPEALDYYAVAAQFSAVLGRAITYRNPSLLHFVWKEIRGGRPVAFTLVMAWLYDQTRHGMSADVTDTVAHLLGRPPIPLIRFIEENRACWAQPAAGAHL